MIKNYFKILSFFLLFNFFFIFNLNSQINNFIIVKVGGSLITSTDLENEIITTLVINKQEVNQTNVDQSKDYAIKKLMNKSIKKNEINKYKIKNFNKRDLEKYIDNVAKDFNTNTDGLRKIFKQNNIDYNLFVENYKIELLWNTLIYVRYKNQINVNIIEVENELEKLKKNKTGDEIKKIKEDILNKKKEEKLSLFSRSHFSNLENTTNIKFNE
tara:strand:- start:4095 stop:4736 length:642 start_codon:yes stop_codon:yes gene_type:complete